MSAEQKDTPTSSAFLVGMTFRVQQSALLLRPRETKPDGEQWAIEDYLAVEQDTEGQRVELIGQVLWLALAKEPKDALEHERDIYWARKLTSSEKDNFLGQKMRGEKALALVRHCVIDSRLAMKVSSVIFSENGDNAFIYYTAPHRVDFRELVKVLARELRARITMKQISPQEEARLLGGVGPYGPCGWWPVDKFKS